MSAREVVVCSARAQTYSQHRTLLLPSNPSAAAGARGPRWRCRARAPARAAAPRSSPWSSGCSCLGATRTVRARARARAGARPWCWLAACCAPAGGPRRAGGGPQQLRAVMRSAALPRTDPHAMAPPPFLHPSHPHSCSPSSLPAPPGVTNELWSLRGLDGDAPAQWTQLQLEGPAPPPRRGHAVAGAMDAGRGVERAAGCSRGPGWHPRVPLAPARCCGSWFVGRSWCAPNEPPPCPAPAPALAPQPRAPGWCSRAA